MPRVRSSSCSMPRRRRRLRAALPTALSRRWLSLSSLSSLVAKVVGTLRHNDRTWHKWQVAPKTSYAGVVARPALTERRKAQTRREIAETALALFARDAYDDVSAEAIAAEA